MITGISKELLENEAKPIVKAFMAERGLQLSPEKTVVTHISDGFDFLGQNIRKYNGKLLIKPSRKNMQTFLTKVRDVIKRNPTVRTETLIMQLNPLLRGWANYHRHVVAKETYNYVDYRVWKLLWQWCRRRHSNRRKRWIKEKYFKKVGSRSWVFQGVRSDGEKISLFYTNDTPIKRHTKIQSEANPYDPQFEQYFEKRLEQIWKGSTVIRRKLYGLWMEQDKRCLVCHHLITQESDWDIHHLIRRVDGGSDNLSNLVMLHPTCHKQLHAAGLKVRKPVRS